MKIAFVIGCKKYDDPDIGDLKYADKDAESFAKTIGSNCGFTDSEVVLLTSNSESSKFWPTHSNIIRELSKGSNLSNVSANLELLFFFFSGHGFHSIHNDKDYLVSQDSVLTALEDTSIPFDNVLKYLRGWNAKNVILFLDACRAVVQGGKDVVIENWNVINVESLYSTDMASFCSCRPKEKSYESDKLENGIFTYGLCEALSDNGKCKTVYELDTYLTAEIPTICKENEKPIQHPYSRVEPLSIQDVIIISEQKLKEWQSLTPIGKELRTIRIEPATNILSRKKIICALDFGTSFSAIAFFDDNNEVRLIPSPQKKFLVPSVISFLSNLDYVVGWEALEIGKRKPESTIFNIKRWLGSRKSFNIEGRTLSPEFITGLIIDSLRRNAEDFLSTKIEEILVSVPANFSILQCNSLAKACELANLKVLRLIGEPLASSLLVNHMEDSQIAFKLVGSFNWDKVPGEDNEKVLGFLMEILVREDSWWANAKIDKKYDDTSILISTGEDSAEITLSTKRDMLDLKLSNGANYDFTVKIEDNTLKIYSIDGQILVLDLGGGTFDASVVEIGDGVYETKGIVGDNNLGGIDYDDAIYQYAISKVQYLIGNPRYILGDVEKSQLRFETERAKIVLSSTDETTIVLYNVEVDEHGLQNFEIPVNKKLFREITAHLNSKVEKCIKQVLKVANVKIKDLDLVLLAGQGSKIFTVNEIIRKLFPNVPIVTKFQESAVIRGLCRYAGVLGGSVKDMLLLDSNYTGIGIKCMQIIEKKPIKLKELKEPHSTNFIISGEEAENDTTFDLLPPSTVIPTLKTYRMTMKKKRNIIILKVVEKSTIEGIPESMIGKIELEVKNDSDWLELSLEVDANRTMLIAIKNPSKKEIHLFQINNFFLNLYLPSHRFEKTEGYQIQPIQKLEQS